MIFKRQATEYLQRWKASPHRKPLVIRGARQTGKTTLVTHFGDQFDTFLYVNLERTHDLSLFDHEGSMSQLLQRIALEKGTALKGETLLFIDEIQHSSNAMGLIRYFYEELPSLFVICTGSLLDVMMEEQGISFPVGRVEYLYLFPLTFAEFLSAIGEDEAALLFEQVPAPSWAHDHLMRLFRAYMVVGGMPEVVARYREGRDITRCSSVYNSLMTSFSDDVATYASGLASLQVVRRIMEVVPSQVGNRIVFNNFGNTGYRSRESANALRILERAMLLYLCYPTTATSLPLSLRYTKSPRLQFIDTGLLSFSLKLQSALLGPDDLHTIMGGMLCEHVVGQELLASSMLALEKPIFWVRESAQSSAQIDYLETDERRMIPIEVKAGSSGRLRSLHLFMEQSTGDLALRFYDGPIQLDEVSTPTDGTHYRLLSLPLYLASQAKEYAAYFAERAE